MHSHPPSLQTFKRLPYYLQYLRCLPSGTKHVSATQIAEAIGLGDVQVRKDLAAVSSGGKPKTGYLALELMKDIERLLSREEAIAFCIVGAGSLGMALAQYQGFAEYGLRLAGVFDANPQVATQKGGSLSILPMTSLPQICHAQKVRLGVITVPLEQAQAACNALLKAGIEAVWNFAPTHLLAPPHIIIEHENMAAQLGILSRQLQRRTETESPPHKTTITPR